MIRVDTTLVTVASERHGSRRPIHSQICARKTFAFGKMVSSKSVAFFASVDKPFSLVLMIDTSGSTRFRLEDIQDAAIAFVNQLRPDDRVMVVSFDDRVRLLSEFTTDRDRLRNAIRQTETRRRHKAVRCARPRNKPATR